jgi:hypothetical protein
VTYGYDTAGRNDRRADVNGTTVYSYGSLREFPTASVPTPASATRPV